MRLVGLCLRRNSRRKVGVVEVVEVVGVAGVAVVVVLLL